jgi:PAS domain S-box-containing protein
MALDSRIVIHANAKVIEMVEQAKYLSDQLIDGLPGFFAIVRPNGEVLRANRNLCQMFGRAEDQVRGLNLMSGMGDAERVRLSEAILSVTDLVGLTRQVELSVLVQNSLRTYRFHISKYGDALSTPLVTVLGTDVTDLRQQERKFSELFGSLPFGLISFDLSGQLSEQYSEYSAWILGGHDLDGTSIQEMIFGRLDSPMTPVQSAAAAALFSSREISDAEFRKIVRSMPGRLNLRVASGGDGQSELRSLQCQW